MNLIEFIQFEVWSTSWICRFVFLEIWENLALSSLNSLSPPLGLWWVLDLFYCPIGPWSSVTFKNLFSFCCSYWMNSVYLSSSSRILTSVITLLSHPATVLFLQFYFSALEFPFFITYISMLRFSDFSFVSREFMIDCWRIFMMSLLKSLSYDSNIWFILVLVFFKCLFSFKL